MLASSWLLLAPRSTTKQCQDALNRAAGAAWCWVRAHVWALQSIHMPGPHAGCMAAGSVRQLQYNMMYRTARLHWCFYCWAPVTCKGSRRGPAGQVPWAQPRQHTAHMCLGQPGRRQYNAHGAALRTVLLPCWHSSAAVQHYSATSYCLAGTAVQQLRGLAGTSTWHTPHAPVPQQPQDWRRG